jgi:hypothetical protein
VFVGIDIKESGFDKLPLDNSPEVLEKKAREILTKLGYEGRPADKASGFNFGDDLIGYVTKNDKPQPDWDSVFAHPSPLFQFWYRQSPENMMATGFWRTSITPGVVDEKDPPTIVPRMVNVELDPQGRLLYFLGVPPEKEAQPQTLAAANWTMLFEAAQLDSQQFRKVAPEWTANVATDLREAWDGTWPGTTRPLHIEAASFHGKPVFFSLMGPWTNPQNATTNLPTAMQRIGRLIGMSLTVTLIVVGVTLARWNYKKGRGDVRGAWRVALVVFGLELLVCVFRAHFVPGIASLEILAIAASTGLFIAALIFVVYLALEPYVRRIWPQTIISWTRLLDGRFRDPMIGRDVLTGTLLGISWCLVFLCGYLFKLKHGALPLIGGAEYMLGARVTAGLWFSTIVSSMLGVMNFFFLLVMLQRLVRNRWLAAGIFVLVFALPRMAGSDHVWADAIVWILIYAIAAYAVVRFGLIALAMACIVANTMLNIPCTKDLSRWYAPNVLFVVLIFVAIAVWGAYTSLGGKKLMKDEAFT